ncbi:TonB-dependent siderophore receptor [Pectobacterium parmentieri]|uniref:TonB-dependent siderophore receptor n=1 Tax=Pectobacterium parmentieri TaxID=1905730 RepID=A0A8B3F8L5_PECPM|nr:TonB-dependent siderophore receptor [Pectobacterium parmentieri]PWD63330.1 TonB-dependent siderophore receptor [Pectobacterium parmentieri]QHQ17031.1 TonB-dependent siderophore receptor [Pectobacterium parmentieri]RKO73902.1 TonB-dependent siderophore receptor [Pectobacterium parmentieri]
MLESLISSRPSLRAGLRSPNLLALFIGSICSGMAMPLLAAQQPTAIQAADSAKASEVTDGKDTITVVAKPEDSFRAGGDQLVPAYLDGQIANGGRVGFLGQQNARDVPFNVVSYTSKMIESQQAQTLGDVVKNDASVQSVRGYGNFAEAYRIRGFKLDGDDITMGGLFGVMPRQIVSTNMIDRVEILKGSNAFLNGVSAGGSGVGGSVNVEPKHADDEPLTRATLDYTSSSQVGGALDIGRRFGDDNRFGVRVNLLHREGEAAIKDQRERVSLAAVGLDYRGDRLRTSLDAGYQHQYLHGGRLGINVSQTGLQAIPEPPANTHNYSQRWVYTDMKSRFGMLRGEYDLDNQWTLYSGIGMSNTEELGNYSTPKLAAVGDGSATLGRLSTAYIAQNTSSLAGIRGNFDTGPVKHEVNLGYSGIHTKAKVAYTMSKYDYASDIYNTPVVDFPATTSRGGDMDSPKIRNRMQNWGLALSDTLSVLDDNVRFTAGLRRQEILIRNYEYTGIESGTGGRFDRTKVSPVYGIVVKPWEHVSLYANHIEALQPGTKTSSAEALNRGQISGIYVAKQNEVGIKVDYQRVGGSLALYEITRANGFIDPVTKLYGLNGEQRNRGVELNVFGEPMFGLRLNGSATLLDATLTKTRAGANDGNDVVGTPGYQLVFGSEYDVSAVEGLTLSGTVLRYGSQYANEANTLKLKPWTRLDLGVRYSTPMNDHTLVWRANVENVTNEKYWASVDDTGTYVTQGDPRSLKLSMSIDF